MKIEQDSFLSRDLPSQGMDSKMVFRNSIYLGCAATRCVSSVQSNAQNSLRLIFLFPTYFRTCNWAKRKREASLHSSKEIANEKSKNNSHNLNTSRAFYATNILPIASWLRIFLFAQKHAKKKCKKKMQINFRDTIVNNVEVIRGSSYERSY